MSGPTGEQTFAREIPDSYVGESVSGVAGYFDLTPYADSWIFLQADGADITLLRGTAEVAPTLGQGIVLTDGARAEEFWVNSKRGLFLNHIATGAGTLKVMTASDG